MTDFSNFHAHSTFSDGEKSPEEMLLTAIELGCSAFGLSEHSHTSYEDFTLTDESAAAYRAEMERLRRKYSDRIDVLCGVEQDINSDAPTDGYDYVIGATHSVPVRDGYRWVDAGSRRLVETVRDYFDSDFLSVAEAYFSVHRNVVRVTHCDFVAHFDIVTKSNEGDILFDTAHPRYRQAAMDAMCEILKDCNVFEVNTGAMFRSGRSEPFPAPWLLRELLARGGEVILSSDAHAPESLLFNFREMEDMLRGIGFRYRKSLTRNGFIDIKL